MQQICSKNFQVVILFISNFPGSHSAKLYQYELGNLLLITKNDKFEAMAKIVF